MKRTIAIAAALLLTGSALAQAEAWREKLDRTGYTIGAPAQEILNYKVDGWNYLDSRHLTVTTGPSERYLITLKTRCPDLGSVETVGFSNTVDRLTRFDKVIVRGAGGIQQDCFIDTIHKLEKNRSPAE
jgi:hypothetical protein